VAYQTEQDAIRMELCRRTAS